MTHKQYIKAIIKKLPTIPNVRFCAYNLQYKKGAYLFPRLQSAVINKKDKVVLLTAGVHGEEISGPLTILNHLSEIINQIHQSGFKFICYPLRNPSGFEKGQRYNIDKDRGAAGNNDFIRYKLSDGTITDDLKDKKSYQKWYWSSDKRLNINIPAETKLLHFLLKKDLQKNIVACLDLHQDFLTPKIRTGAYHYAFGKNKIYAPIINKIKKIVPVLSNMWIGAGYNISQKEASRRVVKPEEAMLSDDLGFIDRHDGCLTDLIYRLGVKHSVTTETTGATPIDKAIKVNMLWIKGLINLLCKRK
jgi:hypothetical protein